LLNRTFVDTMVGNFEFRRGFVQQQSNAFTKTMSDQSLLRSPGGMDQGGEALSLPASLVKPSDLLKSRYRIEKELGRGGFGIAYLASDQLLYGRQVVIKCPIGQIRPGLPIQERFENEIAALAMIQHPAVVSVTDAGVDPQGMPFLVMEFIDGLELRKLILPKGMPMAEVADIIRQIGSALSAAHSRNVCHRDLKPENILIQEIGNTRFVKVIDFGIASITDGLQPKETQLAGTLAYMSPEQLRGQVSAFTDLWSTVVIAYELLTGKVPFEASNPIDLYALQITGQFNPPIELRPDLPAEADAILCHALSSSSGGGRFQSCREFAKALSDALLQTHRASDRQEVRSRSPRAGRLVAKFCNRRSQEDDFRAFFQKHTTDPGKSPLFVFLHGQEGSCHESLVERLIYWVERTTGNSTTLERPATRAKRVPWQYDGSVESRLAHLNSWLFDNLGSESRVDPGRYNADSLGEIVCRFKSRFLILEHDIRCSKWGKQASGLLNEYVRLLAEIPRAKGGSTLLVFFNLIYPRAAPSRGIPSFVTHLLQGRARSGIQSDLCRIQQANGHTPILVLPELGEITKDDVLEWFSLHNIYDSEERRLKASESLFTGEGGNVVRAKQMAEVETKLHDIHKHFLAEMTTL